jgi:TonB-linked SusC/RagA family outer membrane protein
MIKRFTLLLMMIMVSVATTYAQSEVRGVVTGSDDGLGVPGVSVVVKGTTNGVSTNVEGQYIIKNVPSSGTLVFSAVGYISREVNVGNRSSVDVVLTLDEKHLEEVVIIGYGSVSADKHVGASAQINADKISTRPNANVLTALVGSAPGVQSTLGSGSPGANPSIRVRGFGSINASNNALYVVDGVPYDSGIANINPDDVESISILKDASTTAIYGSRGANGVVMITTKSGKTNKSNFNVHASYGAISRGLQEYETVSAQQYYPLMWEVMRNSLHYGNGGIPMDIAGQLSAGTLTSYNGTNYSSIHSMLGYNPFNVPNNQIVDANGVLNPNASLLYNDFDWDKEIQRGGKSRQNYNLSYDGGNEKSKYFASMGYTKEEGFLMKSALERWTGRINASTKATKWLEVGINLNGTFRLEDGALADTFTGSSVVNPFYYSRYIGPIYPVHAHDPVTGQLILDGNGQKTFDMGDKRPFLGGRHAIWENILNDRKRTHNAVGARNFAKFTILPDLYFTTNLSFEYQSINEREFGNAILGDGAPAGRAFNQFTGRTTVNWNQLLEYSKTIGKNYFNVMAGHESYSYKYNYLRAGKVGQSVAGNIELDNFSDVLSTSSYEDNRTVESYFGRLNWDYDGKYIASASLRRDGNSRFAPHVRWANFWSLGGGYNIVKESFFNVPWIDILKFRASYGQVGNDGGIGLYSYQSLYDISRPNNGTSGFVKDNIANPDLTWETGKNFDIGFDFGIFNRRLTGSIEYFNRVTDGLIFSVPVAFQNGSKLSNTGFSINRNIGMLTNKGFELQLNGDVVRTKDFGYNVTLNVTTLKNVIDRMPEDQPLIISGTKAYANGKSIYDFYLREFYGINEEDGAALYRTNQITNNTKIIGSDTLTTVLSEANLRFSNQSSIPDFYGSMNHNLRYKGFSLGVLFTYQVGGKIYDGNYASLMSSGNYGNAMHVDILNRWTEPGTSNTIPRLDNSRTADFSGQSTRWLTSASFLQLNNVTLGYDIPLSVASKINAKTINVYITGENLALWSARKGMNVVGSFNGTVDNNYTFNKVFTGGVKIGF